MPRPLSPLLSREQIATTALTMIDEAGTFTLPGLAKRLGVSPSSIYHHFPGGRETIIEAIRGILSRGWAPAEPESGDWRVFASQWATSYRTTMARHPRVVPFLTAQTVSNPETLAEYELLARVLRAAGFPDEDLLDAVTIIDCFVLGSALDAGAPLDVWADSDDPESALGAAIRAGKADPETRSRRSFEIGLRIVIAGLGPPGA